MNYLFDEFKDVCHRLNKVGIIPTLMGSLGLEFVSGVSWDPSDIDIHVPGDPRGWEAPDELRIYDWDKILSVMKESGYDLIDIHEHEFQKNGIRAEFGSIYSLYSFAGISESDIAMVEADEARFRVPDLRQFLSIYEASSKDSYRNDSNNNKDFAKIEWLKTHLCSFDKQESAGVIMKYIRQATAADLPRIAEIVIFNYRLNFYPIFQNDDYYFRELQVPDVAKQYEDIVGNMWVYDDGAVKGVVQIENGEIKKLFVEPVLQGRSIGSALLKYAIGEHKANTLWALEKNVRAIRFYECHGFHITTDRKPEEDTTEYLIRLER